jgi:hypothetical protein
MQWDIASYLEDVVGTICDCLGVQHPNATYFKDAEEGEVGTPWLNDDYIYYVFDNAYPHHGDDLVIGYYDYSVSIPRRYLMMTLAEVEIDIKRQIKADNNANTKTVKRELIASAKNKLTTKELAALGLER